MYIRQQITEINMAKTVPRAEPITPSLNCFMNIKVFCKKGEN